jgi:hypothetical protein
MNPALAKLALTTVDQSNAANISSSLVALLQTNRATLGGQDVDNAIRLMSNALASVGPQTGDPKSDPVFDISNNIIAAASELQNTPQSSLMASEGGHGNKVYVYASVEFVPQPIGFELSQMEAAIDSFLTQGSSQVVAFGSTDAGLAVTFKVCVYEEVDVCAFARVYY